MENLFRINSKGRFTVLFTNVAKFVPVHIFRTPLQKHQSLQKIDPILQQEMMESKSSVHKEKLPRPKGSVTSIHNSANLFRKNSLLATVPST